MGLIIDIPKDAPTLRVFSDLEQIDELLSERDVYYTDENQAERMRFQHVISAVSYHIHNNPRYAAYCKHKGFDLCFVKSTNDLHRIPLLPSAIFKRRNIEVRTLSLGADPSDILPTTSSGTQGSLSIVPRDDATLMRFFASVSAGVRDVLGVDDFTIPVLNLGPSPSEAQHLWISYVLAGAGVFFESENYVRQGELIVGEVIEDLLNAARDVLIVGPPALILEICDAFPGDIALHPDSLVVSAGGWKNSARGTIDRETFREACAQKLKIDPNRVRDAFNMVELNTVVFECSEHNKHIPPWLYVSALHAKTLLPVDEGERGLLAYLDPTARSYPGFILSDDFGWVRRGNQCNCGLRTDLVGLDRRVNRVESRGCAMKMNYSPMGNP